MENHPFPPILKAEVEFVKWRAEDMFAELLTGFGGARYPKIRRATHIRGATHIASPSLAKEHGRYALAARYALGRGATHIVTEPKKICFLRPASYQNATISLQVGFNGCFINYEHDCSVFDVGKQALGEEKSINPMFIANSILRV